CPYNDSDGVEHVRIVFGLATAFGVDADFHVDFSDEPEHLHVREIAAQTVRAGWQGRVAVGHLTELAAVPGFRQDELIAEIAGAGLGVICLPATDLYLMGRQDLAWTLPGRTLVVKRGRVSVEARHEIVDRWRAP